MAKSCENNGIVGTDGRRDSFERLGDDLSEEVISYLSLKDKFRFECLSKRWQRLVFNKVFELKTNEAKGLIPLLRSSSDPNLVLMDLKHFSSFVKKCRFCHIIVENSKESN